MDAVMINLLNMSLVSVWLILAVVIMRFLLRKAPKYINLILWAFVGVRLVCPFSFESVLSLIPTAETIPSNIQNQKAQRLPDMVKSFKMCFLVSNNRSYLIFIYI